MSNRITISGGVVAEPETFADGKGLKFPLYDNERKKNRDTGEYEDTGNVTKLQVVLWGDTADQWRGKIGKGDVVEVEGTIVEKEFQKKDGTTGRQLETSFVNQITIKFQKDRGSASDSFGAADAPF